MRASVPSAAVASVLLLACAGCGPAARPSPRTLARAATTAPVAAMGQARQWHTATLLSTGRVLVAGGDDGTTVLASAGLYDPATGTWAATGSMAGAREQHTATLLPSGKVLVAGGWSGSSTLDTAELYDPATGAWTATGALIPGGDHAKATATLLTSGKVLLVGGLSSTAQLYDPTAGTWSATGSTAVRHHRGTAVRLRSGKVLLVGGVDLTGASLATAERYDPASGTWSATGSLATARTDHFATLLPTGQVLAGGGWRFQGGTAAPLASAELYDEATGAWSATASLANTASGNASATLLPSGRLLVVDAGWAQRYDPATGTWAPAEFPPFSHVFHTATLLPSSKVLLAGGQTYVAPSWSVTSRADEYDPSAPAFSATPPFDNLRWHTATLLPSGQVLTAGGWNGTQATARASLYAPSGIWSATGVMAAARFGHTATLLPSGQVLVAGGYDGTKALAGAELYDPAVGTWRTVGSLHAPRWVHTATLLASGRVLVAGGFNGTAAVAGAELYDPVTETWTAVGSLGTGRFNHTAVLLPTGKVLVAGGLGAPFSYLAGAELYDPASGTWAATAPLPGPRAYHTATLLPSGKVLVAAGSDQDPALGPLPTAELYDAASGTWSMTGMLATPRAYHAATLLPSGRVLVTGGSGVADLGSAEWYDPATGAWSSAGSLTQVRAGHASTLLPSGRVLVTGGPTGGPPIAGADLFDEGLTAPPARTPTLTGPIPPQVIGGVLAVAGTLFTGDSEGSSGSAQSSPSSHPLLQILRQDGEAETWAPITGFTPTAATAALPATLRPGPHWVRVFVNGVASAALPVRLVSPLGLAPASPSVPPRGTLSFTASGGSGSYTFSLATNGSGGTAFPDGRYQAGTTGSATDVVAVADSLGFTATTRVTVTAGVSLTPPSVTLPPRGRQQFTASGGSGVGYTFGNMGGVGNIDATGLFDAGPFGNHTTTIAVVDSLGNRAEAGITIGPGITVPASQMTIPPLGRETFAVSGGSGGGYAWVLNPGASGGTLDGATGAYAAGPVGGVTDSVTVTDSLGNQLLFDVQVTAGVAIAPASVAVAPGESRTFTASGGSGSGFVWSFASNGSGGRIDAATGAYTAGAAGGATDTVRVTDSLGNAATAAVTVTAPAAGGCGCGSGGAGDLSLIVLGLLLLGGFRRTTLRTWR